MQTGKLRRSGAARRGVTLVEAVLFISISLGLIMGGIVFFQQAMAARKTQEFDEVGSVLAPTTLTPAEAASADYCMVNDGEPVHMRLLVQI